MIDLRRIQGPPPLPQEQAAQKRADATLKGEFDRTLREAQGRVGDLRFSAHALERMAQRGIELTGEELERVQDAVETAAAKGSRSSLILLDERAFVVSVANRTVVTALEGERMKDQVVTDIDSAVIL